MASGEQTMIGRTCIVTGAASGLGPAVAQGLARLGAQVLLVAPSESAAQHIAETIRQEVAHARIVPLGADLSSQSQVRHLADTILGSYPQIDVLVHGLAARFPQRHESVDGIEMTLAVNVLAPFLLTNLLLDLCRACAPMRIVTLSSERHRQAVLDLDDLQTRGAYRCPEVCARCRLANLLLTYELSRRLSDIGITANAVDPGGQAFEALAADCEHPEGTWARISRRVRTLGHNGGSESSAADVVVALASEPRYEGTTGQYYVRGHPTRSSEASYDPVAARRLWEMIAALTYFPALA